MAAVRGGDIRQFSWYGRTFDPAPEQTVNLDLGGFTNAAGLTGNKQLHVTQTRKVAGFSDLRISIDEARKDQEFLQAKADAGVPGPCTMTMASGIVYSGSLLPVGDIAKASDGYLSVEGRGASFEQI